MAIIQPTQRVAFVGDDRLGNQLGALLDDGEQRFCAASSIDDLAAQDHPDVAIVAESSPELASTVAGAIREWPRTRFLFAPPATDIDLIATTRCTDPSEHPRILGLGTSPISTLLRNSLSDRLGIYPDSAFIETAGSTAAQVIPLWSAARVSGVPLHLFKAKGKRPITVQERSKLSQDAIDGSKEIGNEVQVLPIFWAAHALLEGGDAILSMSSVQTSLAGQPREPTVFSFPTLVGCNGVTRVLDEWPLNPAELAGLQAVAEQNRL